MSWNAAQRVIFPRWFDPLVRIGGLIGAIVGGVVTFVVVYGFSPKTLDEGYQPRQPVPYSHRLHVGQLGLDCRYCHTSVERGPKANVPPTQTCMNCHSKVLTDSPALAPIRKSFETGMPVEWIRVHDLPDFVYFDHSAHVTRGIGCISCHGRIDQMEVVHQEKPLSMAWCVDCHRHPEKNLRPPSEVTNMTWAPPGPDGPVDTSEARIAWGTEFMKTAAIHPPTSCSTCHR